MAQATRWLTAAKHLIWQCIAELRWGQPADCRGRLSALGCAKAGKPDQLARAHYGKDITGVVCNFINDPIWLDDKLSESDEVGEVLFKRAFRHGRAGKREVRKVGYGVVES